MTLETQPFDLEAYYAGLPKKRTAAAVLIGNGQGQFLFVELSYKDGWVLPGGSTDANEAPMATAIREVREEVGLAIEPQRLLMVAFYNTHPVRHDVLEFCFYAEVDQGAVVTIDSDEIMAYHWATIEEAMPHLGKGWVERVQNDVYALGRGNVVWVENGKVIA